LTNQLAEQGRIIEGGWTGFAFLVLNRGLDPIKAMELRKAFYAGALHLFSSIMVMLDPGAEPSEKDLKKMELISKELQEFEASLRPARN